MRVLVLALSLVLTAPDSLTLYSPVDYNEVGEPTSKCLECYPMFWMWPNGRTNLTGVFYSFWSPPMNSQIWNPRTKRSMSVNYWGWIPDSTLSYSGFQEQRMSYFTGVTADSIITLRRGGVVFTAVTDSILEGGAWIILSNPLWSRDDSLVTYFRIRR